MFKYFNVSDNLFLNFFLILGYSTPHNDRNENSSPPSNHPPSISQSVGHNSPSNLTYMMTMQRNSSGVASSGYHPVHPIKEQQSSSGANSYTNMNGQQDDMPNFGVLTPSGNYDEHDQYHSLPQETTPQPSYMEGSPEFYLGEPKYTPHYHKAPYSRSK